ncbi:TPA: lipase [Enterococcus hirae]|uniref:lipase family protein n=1 Tax=Enterococcus hirae TaxID=1354 RepID=UPI000DEB3BB1|nr:lipase [Enterococcus hirae]RBT48089.1 hypothetical protein EA74_02347 [Enterococcus hirae]RBT66231.1 hypothetical protein EA82_02744 [Enterococcus hirae]
MTITDEDYRYLSEHVYWLDPKHPKYNPTYKEGVLKLIGKTTFKILKIQENSKTDGMQAMAVAPIRNGVVDQSSIVIVYAGTNTADINDIMTDLITIGGLFDKTASPGFSIDRSPQRLDGQATSSLQFAHKVKQSYSEAQITTTGHSLGAYLALLVATENQWRSVSFNGPDPYEILTSKAKKWAKKHGSWLNNYRQRGDLLGNFMGDRTGAEIKVNLEMELSLFAEAYHSLASWKFDAKGRLVIPKNDFNQKALVKQEEYYLNKNFESELATLHKTREKLKKINNGNLSTNVRLYLDRQQASLVIHQAKSTHQLALTKTVNIYQTAISETELDWKKMLRLAKYQTNRLSDAEIKEYLAIGGATRQKIVLEPARLYQEKINQAKKIDQRFERLAQELNKKIAEILQRDRELAQLLK